MWDANGWRPGCRYQTTVPVSAKGKIGKRQAWQAVCHAKLHAAVVLHAAGLPAGTFAMCAVDVTGVDANLAGVESRGTGMCAREGKSAEGPHKIRIGDNNKRTIIRCIY